MSTSLTDLFGPVISSYSRAQAIEDGVLIDLTTFSFRPNLNVCQEAGLKFPVAITSAAYDKAIGGTEDNPLPPAQDLSGRTYDVVSMLRFAIKRGPIGSPAGGSEVRYKLNVWNWCTRDGKRINKAKHELVTLKALCGPGDDGEPVITIMLPHES